MADDDRAKGKANQGIGSVKEAAGKAHRQRGARSRGRWPEDRRQGPGHDGPRQGQGEGHRRQGYVALAGACTRRGPSGNRGVSSRPLHGGSQRHNMDRMKTLLARRCPVRAACRACGGGSSSTPASDPKPPVAAVASHRTRARSPTWRRRRRRASPACRLTPYRRAPARTTWRPRPMAASGTRPRARASSAGSTRATARSRRYRWARARRRTASSSARTVLPGSRTAASTPWCASTPRPSRSRFTSCPARGSSTSTPPLFDKKGQVWFTGQGGVYGRLNPQTGEMQVYDAPKGTGPYGITVTPNGDVYYASLAGSYVGKIDVNTGQTTVLNPPTAGPGRAPRLVGLEGPRLGGRMERRQGRHVRPGDQRLEGMAAPRLQAPGLRRLRRRQGQGLVHRLRRQRRHRPLRPRRRRSSTRSRCRTPRATSASSSVGPAKSGAPSPPATRSSSSATSGIG